MALPAFENLVEDNPADSLPSFDKLVEDSPDLPPIDKLVEDQPDAAQIDTEVSNIMAAPHGELPQPMLRGAPAQSELSRNDTIPPDQPTEQVLGSLQRQNQDEAIYPVKLKELQDQFDTQFLPAKKRLQDAEHFFRVPSDAEYFGIPIPPKLQEARDNFAEQERLLLQKRGEVAALGGGSPVPLADENGVPYKPTYGPQEHAADLANAEQSKGVAAEAERQKNIKLLGREPAWWETFPVKVRALGADMLTEGMRAFQNSNIWDAAKTQEMAGVAHDLSVRADLGKGVANDMARGTADVLAIMGANPAGKAGILAAAFKGAELARARTYDETGDENKANQAALNSLITLPILLATGQAASKFASGLLPEGASALKVGATELAAGTTANVGTDLLIHAVEGQPYDWRSFTADALFALHGAWGRFAEAATAKGDMAGAATANQAQEKIGEALGQKDPEMQRLAENLQKASAPTGEPNAQQIDQTGTPDGGVQPRSEVSQLPTQEGGQGVQPSGQGGLAPEAQPAAPQEGELAPNFGPGAANTGEFAARPVREIGAYNADVDARRAARGAEPLFSIAREKIPQTWDKAVDRIEQNPDLPNDLIEGINNDTIKSVTKDDQAAILWKLIDLENRRLDAEEKSTSPDIDPADKEAYREEFLNLDAKLNAAEEANRKAGTYSSESLGIRRLIATENFTYARMLRRAELSKGEPLTEVEKADVKKQSEGILRTEAELASKDPNSPESGVDESIRQIEAEASKNPDFTPEVKSLADRIIARLETAATAALSRLRGKLAGFGSAPDPTILSDVVIYGASKIAKGLVKFGQWSAAMIKDFGDGVKPYLQDAWTGANKHLDDRINASATPKQRVKVKEAVTKENVSKVSDEIRAEMKARVAGGEKITDLRATVQKLMETVVRGGVKGRDAVVDAVHEQLKTVDPTITRRQTMDLMSGYGNFKKLNPDAIKAEVRDYKQQLQLVAKIEDVQAKIPLAKSGVERQTLSDESRRLTAELNENIKKHGIVMSDPATQLKTILAAQETRLTNRIKDLRQEIADGERRVKTKTQPPTSEKIEALKKELAEVEAEHEKVFGSKERTDEQKLASAIASAKRGEVTENARLKKAKRGVFDKPIKNPAMKSAELDAIKARTEAARAERQALEESANPPMSEAQKRLDSALVARERWEQLLAGEIAPAKKMTPEALTQLEEDARTEIAAMRDLATQLRKKAAELTPDEAEAKKAQKQLDQALNELARLEGIASGEITPEKPVTKEALSQLEEDTRLEIDALRKAIAEQKKAPPKDEHVVKENAQVKALEKAASEFERRVNEADFSRKGKQHGPDTARVAQARALRDAAKAAFDAAHEAANPGPSAEQKKVNAIKAAVLRRNADIQERIAKGEFEPRKKAPPVDLSKDPSAVAAKAENDRLKKQFALKQHQWQQAQRGKTRKVLDFVKDVAGASRSLITSADVSAPFRQGGVLFIGDLFTHPVRAFKQIGSMFKQLFSEKAYEKAQAEIALRPNTDLYQKSGLYFSDLDSKLSAREESMRSNLAEKVPLGIGKIVRGSNRAYTGFLNRQRADAFDALVESLGGRAALSDADTKLLANAVNVLTGRGTAAGFERAANSLATYFFSPRFLTSRIQTLIGHPIMGQLGQGASPAVRRAIARQYVKFAWGLSVVYGLAMLDKETKVEKDPRSSDFGKIRFGSTRLDPMAGLQQVLVLLSRTASGQQKVQGQMKPVSADTYYRFARSKLAPVPGTLLDLRVGKNVVGEKVTPGSAAKNLTVPMSYQDVNRIYREHSGLKSTALEMLNLLGMGLQDYGR